MTSEVWRELFDTASANNGMPPRYLLGAERSDPRDLIQCTESLVEMLRDVVVSEAVPGELVPEVYGSVNESWTFNACVFKEADRYFVSINIGALILIEDLVQRLLSVPEVFPWVGTPSKEDPDRQFHPPVKDAMKYMRTMIEDPRPARPKDPKRRAAANMFGLVAIEFVVAHEVWHVMGGHLDWMGRKEGTSPLGERLAASIYEMSSIGEDKRRRLVQQALEMDADAFAMFHLLRRLFALAEAPRDGSPFGGILSTQEQCLEVAIACGAVMVGTFFSASPDPSTWAYRSHPPAAIRHGMIIVAADKALLRMKLEDLRAATTARPTWVAEIGNRVLVDVWTRLGNDSRSDELTQSFGDAGKEHFRQVLETWMGIASDVRSCAPVKFE